MNIVAKYLNPIKKCLLILLFFGYICEIEIVSQSWEL